MGAVSRPLHSAPQTPYNNMYSRKAWLAQPQPQHTCVMLMCTYYVYVQMQTCIDILHTFPVRRMKKESDIKKSILYETIYFDLNDRPT